MAEYVDFHYMPLEGKITGKQVLKQTEDAINDLGQHVYEIDIDNEKIQEAIDTSNQAIETAEEALAVVTTNRAVWYNSVTELREAIIDNGIVAAIKGYAFAGDEGQAFYVVREKKSGDVDDGKTIIFLDAGNVAEIIANTGITNMFDFDEDGYLSQIVDGDISNQYGEKKRLASYEGQQEIVEAFNDVINASLDIKGNAESARNSAEIASNTMTQLLNYLATKEEITAPIVDPTLTISGAAADAKVTGDDIRDISEVGKNLFDKNLVNSVNGYINNGTIASNANARTVYIPCEPSTTYTVSKQSATARFSVAYTTTMPDVGVSVYDVKQYHSNTAITITTGASATYLVAFVYLSTADTKTFEEICNMLQIEKGSSATAYVPYKLNAVDTVARNGIQDLKTFPQIQSAVTSVSLDTEMIASFSAMTPINGATYSDGVWSLPDGGGISTTLTVEANKTYLVVLGVVPLSTDMSDDSSNYKFNPLTITLGDASIGIFSANDGNFRVALTPTTAGTVTFSVVCSEFLSLRMESLSVKKVINYADYAMTINGNAVNVSTYGAGNLWNIAVDGGQVKLINGRANTALGFEAQRYIDTGIMNTAVGYHAEMKLTVGSGNVGIGNRAQQELTAGMYNNAVGTVAQGNITTGCWNNAFGNETQRDLTTGCNNTSMGRRAHSYLTTGNMNVAIGAMSGFATDGAQGGQRATTTASFQTLVGGESLQASAVQSDYLTAIGFRAKGNEKGTALGALSSATGEKSVAIGYGVSATNDNEVVIGYNAGTIVLCGKRIIFNVDGSVSWESA